MGVNFIPLNIYPDDGWRSYHAFYRHIIHQYGLQSLNIITPKPLFYCNPLEILVYNMSEEIQYRTTEPVLRMPPEIKGGF